MEERFIEFLIKKGALQLGGPFITKSGRETPYFVNTGKLNDGSSLYELAGYYCLKIKEEGISFDAVFGPAYKGIPLAAAISLIFWCEGRQNIKWCSNRKEFKDHGDKGNFLGALPKEGERLLLVEDVITAGTTFFELVPLLRSRLKVEIVGAVVAVDREEKGAGGELTAKSELEQELGLPIFPLVSISDIISYMEAKGGSFDPQIIGSMKEYIRRYGGRRR